MGGMQVLEWAITYPQRVRSIVPIATCMQATAQQIAWGAIGRRAIALDPRWRGGDYYDAAPATARTRGWRSPAWSPRSRSAATTCSPTASAATSSTGRARRHVRAVAAVRGRALPRAPRRQARPPLRRQQLPRHRQGDGPPRRRPRPRQPRRRDGPDHAPAAWSIGISSDLLYPNYQQRQIDEMLRSEGTASRYVEIDSPHGHDAFLINLDQLADPIAEFLDQVSER